MKNSQERSTKKVGNYIVTNPGSVKIIANKLMEEGQGIVNKQTEEVIMNPVDVGMVVLEMSDGDYGVLFEQMGVNEDSIKAATQYANRQISAFIDARVEEALKKFQ